MRFRTSILSVFQLLLPTVAVSIAGCSLLVDVAEKSPAEGVGDGSDGGSPPACADWGKAAQDLDLCNQSAATQSLVIDNQGWSINTDNGELRNDLGDLVEVANTNVTMTNGIEAHLLMVRSLRLESTLNAYGSRPLLIASWGDIEIDGALQVDGTGDLSGPGANPARCLSSTGQMGLDDGGGASGAGGGALGGAGGTGGSGDSDDPNTPGGAGGTVDPSQSGLQGGCAGGDGGSQGGTGGYGGGAVALAAIGRIQINGTIEAVGHGGRGGQNDRSGGGGGGSGGMIMLSADRVEIRSSALLSANGGGGGGGAEQSVDGGDGDKGTLGIDAANGGDAPSGGGRGGGGSSLVDLAGGGGGQSFAGGGGGGGGAGIIAIEVVGSASVSIDAESTISPEHRDL